MTDLRRKSIIKGLVIPDDEAWLPYYAAKAETPSLREMELAKKPHPWPEMRKLHVDFFKNYINKATEYEEDMLRICGLPSIDEVREKSVYGFGGLKQGEFEYTPRMEKEIDDIFAEWEADLVDDSDGRAIYHSHVLDGFAVGLAYTYRELVSQLPKDLRSVAGASRVFPAIESPYLGNLVRDGTKRITARLSKKYLPEIKAALEYMGRTGANPIEVGRMIHGMAGEGQAWWWWRNARSESCLASDAGFEPQARALGAKYEEWSCGGSPCQVCSMFCGLVWKLGEGPRPVQDTHPNCVCRRKAWYNVKDRPIQGRWARQSPYEHRYTQPEIDRRNQQFQMIHDQYYGITRNN